MAEVRYYMRGELDLATAQETRNALVELVAEHDADLCVDCSQLTFIDSTGVTVLLEANRELEQSGRHMLITNTPDQCRRVFEILGLGDLLRYDRTS